MICPTCKIPMDTETNSAEGFSDGKQYYTAEIKVCSNCGLRVKEEYRATYYPKEEIIQV